MKSLPMGCRDRYDEISKRVDRLFEMFLNGNRGEFLKALEEMEPRAAFAVLAEIMFTARPDVQGDLHRFLKEVA